SLARAFAEAMGLELVADLDPRSVLTFTLSGPLPVHGTAERAVVTGGPGGPPAQEVAMVLAFVLCAAAASAQDATAPETSGPPTVALVAEPGRPLRVALDSRLRVKRVGQPVSAT